MLTPRQYADHHGVAYTTVINWLNRELIQGAKKEELPFGGYYWTIPMGAAKPDLKTGPKPRTVKSAKGKSK